MRVVTERDVPNTSGGWPRRQRMESHVRRDQDRLDVAQRLFFPNARQDPRAHRWRAVTTKDMCVMYYAGLEEVKIPNGLVDDDWASWFKRHGLNETTGGPLDGYFPSTGSRRVAELMSDSPHLRLLGSETIGGTSCKIVEGRTPYGTYTMWLAESKGYLPLKVTSVIGPNDSPEYGDNRRFSELTISAPDGKRRAGSSSSCVLEDVAVAQIGDAFVPVAGKFTRTDSYTDVRLIAANTYERTEVQLNPRFGGTDAFVIDLPEGSPLNNLSDRTSGVVYEWRDGKVVPDGTVFGGVPAVGSWAQKSAVVLSLMAIVGLALFVFGSTVLSRRNRRE